jgi:hypothetical protein
MLNFEKYVHTQTGKYILSIILGLGLASLFRSVCKGKNCIVFYAANIEDIQNKTWINLKHLLFLVVQKEMF